KTLQEILEGNVIAEPEWYNNGVEYLMKDQHEEGWWSTGCGVECDTAFSVLFLVRSMQQSYGKGVGDGFALGRQGDRPKDITKLVNRGGKLINEQPKKDISELLKMIEDGKMDDLAGVMDDPSTLVVKDVNP